MDSNRAPAAAAAAGDKKLNKRKNTAQRRPANMLVKRTKRTSSHTNDRLLNILHAAVEANIIRGFVYGILLDNGMTMSAASDNFRPWWKDKVQFDKYAIAALNAYYGKHQNADVLPSVPIGKALLEICDRNIGSMISTLMPKCWPAQRKYPLKWGVSPPWWPTGEEEWWPEMADVVDKYGVPPYRKPHRLRKVHKVAVLVAIIRHMAPDYGRITAIVRKSNYVRDSMTSREATVWDAAIVEDCRRYLLKHRNAANATAVKLMNSFDDEDEDDSDDSSQNDVTSEDNGGSDTDGLVGGRNSEDPHCGLFTENEPPELFEMERESEAQSSNYVQQPTSANVAAADACNDLADMNELVGGGSSEEPRPHCDFFKMDELNEMFEACQKRQTQSRNLVVQPPIAANVLDTSAHVITDQMGNTGNSVNYPPQYVAANAGNNSNISALHIDSVSNFLLRARFNLERSGDSAGDHNETADAFPPPQSLMMNMNANDVSGIVMQVNNYGDSHGVGNNFFGDAAAQAVDMMSTNQQIGLMEQAVEIMSVDPTDDVGEQTASTDEHAMQQIGMQNEPDMSVPDEWLEGFEEFCGLETLPEEIPNEWLW